VRARQRWLNGLLRHNSWLKGIRHECGAAVCASSLLGCANLSTANDWVNPAEPMWLHRPVGALQVVFARALVAPPFIASNQAVERGRPEIDAAHGRVFVGTSDHGLYALRASDGSALWRFQTLGVVESEPLYDGELDTVYFGSDDGALYAVHAADGRLEWRYDTGAEVARKPVRLGEVLYVANGSDNLFAIDRRSGATRWRVHRTPALGMEISGYAGPAVDGDKVFFAYSDGHVGAYDAKDGSEKWPTVDLSAEAEQSRGSEALRYLDVDTTPIPQDLGALGRVVFVASYQGGVFALDEERGVTVWRDENVQGVTDLTLWSEPAHMPHPTSPEYVPDGPAVPARSVLLASSGQSGLWALDPSTGRKVWQDPLPDGGVTAPAPIAGALLVGTTEYGAFLVSVTDGRRIDGVDLGTGFSGAPATFGGRGYLLSNGGTLVALQVAGPNTDWRMIR
jgi:outer membrane protein assembly factor BamB